MKTSKCELWLLAMLIILALALEIVRKEGNDRIAELERSMKALNANVDPMYQHWKAESGYMFSAKEDESCWVSSKKTCLGIVTVPICTGGICENREVVVNVSCKEKSSKQTKKKDSPYWYIVKIMGDK